MERNTNNEITTLPVTARLRSIGRAVHQLVCFFPTEAPDFMSNHYRPAVALPEPGTDWPQPQEL